MGEFFKLTFLDEIPDPARKRPINRYNTAIRQFLKSDKPVALIKAQSKQAARTIVSGMRREIRFGRFPVNVVQRGTEVYITSKGEETNEVSD